MADKTIKHFVFSRFFPAQTQKYLYNVLAPNFLKTQLPLAKNMLSSLENQTNKNFELVFLMHPQVFDDPMYEFVFSTLRASTTLPITFIKRAELRGLVENAYDNYDFVIRTGMDFDDFVYKDAVAEAQSKVNGCDTILTCGYGKGFIYSKGELYSHLPTERSYLINNIGYVGLFRSTILKSSFAKTLPYFGDFSHANLIPPLKDFLEKNNVEIPEDVYQKNISVNAFIYFRHEFSQQHLLGFSKTKGKTPMTTEDITKKQLEEEFGFRGYELNSIK